MRVKLVVDFVRRTTFAMIIVAVVVTSLPADASVEPAI